MLRYILDHLLFFVIFILIATFTMLNLFIAIIVNAMHSFTEEENRETQAALNDARDHIEADLHQEMAELRGEIAELKQLLNPALDSAQAPLTD